MSENAMITYHQATSWGPDFRCSVRTGAHIDWTKAKLPKGTSLRIIQPSYNVGYGPSAGTHDGDAVLDVQVVGMDWRAGERFLRECRWAAWYRFPPIFSSEHIHMVSLGANLSLVGSLVPAQITDYKNWAFGLSGMHTPGSDRAWHPDPILPFKMELVDRAVPRNKAPKPSKWNTGDVYVEKLHEGQRDSDSVRRLQYRLLNHDHIPALKVKVNGHYDAGTVSAVRFFQHMAFTDPDPKHGERLSNRQAQRLFGPAYNLIEVAP